MSWTTDWCRTRSGRSFDSTAPALWNCNKKFCSFEGKVEGEGQPHPLLHTFVKM